MKNAAMLSLVAFVALNSSCTGRRAMPESEEEKTIYAMGAMLFGHRLKSLNLTDKEMAILFQGAEDALRDNPQVNISEYFPKVRDFAQVRGEAVLSATREEGAKFVEQYMKDEGDKAQKTESGLVYKVIQEGSGDKPGADDTVRVKYKGQLIDGQVFDENTEGIDLPLNRVIKGWAEGLRLMAPGGKMELIIPPDIGYGDAGAPPKIPGASTLRFSVELVSIEKNGDAE